MTVTKRRLTRADKLALGAWITVGLTPAGWVLGVVLALMSCEGEAEGAGPVALGITGVLLFGAAPAAAVILAVHAARAGHRSGRAAVMVAGALLLATLVLTMLLGWIGLIVVAAVTVLVFVATASRGQPPPGPGGTRPEGRSPATTAPPRASGRT